MAATAVAHAVAAIVLWSTMAWITTQLGHRDPVVVCGIGLTIAGLLAAPTWRSWRLPWRTWAVGVGGILGYHLLYFAAFAHGPAVEVNLVNYLWPVLMVVLAPVLARQALGWRPFVAVLLGASGCLALLLHAPEQGRVDVGHDALGIALAGMAAVVWAVYSLLTVRLPPFPSTAVGGFCLVSGCCALVLAAVKGGAPMSCMHDLTLREWLLMLAVGAGPLGLAFVCWDAALKRADPQRIAALAYATPALSTCWLALGADGRVSLRQVIALALIVAGAVLAGWPAPVANRGHHGGTPVN